MRSVFAVPVDPALLFWKCWENWPDWTGSRGYALTQGEEIASHGTVVPLICRWEDRAIPVVRVIDWAASAKATGSGVVLMNRIGKMSGAIMAVGGTEVTLKIFPALGAKPFGHAYRYARPLRPFARFIGEPTKNTRALARLVRALLWSLRGSSEVPAGWTARRMDAGQLDSASFPRPHPRPGLAVFERSTASLHYYLKCPGALFELHVVEKDGNSKGYLLMAYVDRQARLAESWVESDDPEDWRALHCLAVRVAREHAEVDPLTRESLEAAGFHLRGSMELHLIDTAKKGLPDVPLRVQMLEGDAAYLQSPTEDFWA